MVTEAELERHGREAAELRALAAELRAALDRPVPPPVRRSRRPSARAVSALLGVLLAVLAVLTWVTIRDPGTAGDGERRAGNPAPLDAVAAPELRDVRLELVPDGDRIRVVQRLELTGSGPLALRLSAPEGLGSQLGGLAPRVTGLRARLDGAFDGRALEVDAGGSGTSWRIDVPAAGTALRLDYALEGAVIRSTPSVQGRALALVLPLVPSGPASPSLEVSTDSGAVRGVSCPSTADLLCARSTADGGWQASVPVSANPAVLLQLDLA